MKTDESAALFIDSSLLFQSKRWFLSSFEPVNGAISLWSWSVLNTCIIHFIFLPGGPAAKDLDRHDIYRTGDVDFQKYPVSIDTLNSAIPSMIIISRKNEKFFADGVGAVPKNLKVVDSFEEVRTLVNMARRGEL